MSHKSQNEAPTPNVGMHILKSLEFFLYTFTQFLLILKMCLNYVMFGLFFSSFPLVCVNFGYRPNLMVMHDIACHKELNLWDVFMNEMHS
jgi:hypothetical protein